METMADDYDYLKRNRIEPPATSAGAAGLDGGMPSWAPPVVSEAFGGSGEPVAEAVPAATLRERIVGALKGVYDPEIPVNIYDLGLIYGIFIEADASVEVQMTLTAPACPVAGALVQEVATRVGSVLGVRRSHVTLTWDPPWTPERMTEAAKLELGFLY